VLTEDEVLRMIEAAGNLRDKALIAVGCLVVCMASKAILMNSAILDIDNTT